MTRGFYDLTSGMLSQSRRLDVVGNNMTNLSTPGYKQQQYTDTTFGEVLISRIGNSDKSRNQVIGQSSSMLAPSEMTIDYGQGALEETGSNLDFAIQGEGFFAIRTDNGVEYTRNGSFSLDKNGYLYLPGYGRVLDEDKRPIQLDTDQIRVDSRGGIYGQEDGEYYGKVGVFTFRDNDRLTISESGLFDAGGQGAREADTPVIWKSLESSNVDMIREMSQMMSAQRALQSAAQVLKLYDGVLTKATSELGRM